jgi:hypothetical protein
MYRHGPSEVVCLRIIKPTQIMLFLVLSTLLLAVCARAATADLKGIRSNGSVWLEFGPGIFKCCKRIDWYRGHLPKPPVHSESGWVEADLTNVDALTLKSSDSTFQQTLEWIKGNFQSKFNFSPNNPVYQSATAVDGALILYSSDTDFPPEQWFCMPHLTTDVGSGEKMYPDVLAVIPITRETLGCEGDVFKAQLAELESLMRKKGVPARKSLSEIEQHQRLVEKHNEMNKTFGFIDTSGKMVFNAGTSEDMDTQFKCGLLRVKDHGMRFWNKSGKLAFDGAYDDALQFSEGMCAVRVGDKWGFINTSGQMIIPPAYENTGYFHENLAPVCLNGKWGYVDASGKEVIAPRFDLAIGFSEGLAVVSKGEKIGYIDTSGRMVIEPPYDEGGSFSEGLVSVIRLGGSEQRYHSWFLDKAGNKVIDVNEVKLKYDKEFLPDKGPIIDYGGHREIFVGKKAPFGSKGCKRYFEEGACEFHDGLCVLTWANRHENDGSPYRAGFINKQGRIAIEPKFVAASSFKGGIAYVVIHDEESQKMHSDYGFIDTKGDFVIKPQFALLEQFSDGLSSASKASFGGDGFIDRSGNWVIPPTLENLKPFSDGLARIGQTIDVEDIQSP